MRSRPRLSERELERLVRDLRANGYTIGALVEHESANRTATVRLVTREGFHVAFVCASSGIEPEIVRARLALIRARGSDRGEDLAAKLESVLAAVRF